MIYSFFLFFNLIKTAAKFMRTESVKCPARVVFAKSRARHVHIMSLNLLTSHKNYLINRVSYVHSPRTTDESLHCFVLPFQLILFSRIKTARHLVRSDFLQRSTQTLKYVDEFPEQKYLAKFKKNTRISLSLSLSTCRSADGMFTLMSLYICKHGLDPDQTRMVFRIECFVNLKMCAYGRKYAKRYM